MTKPKLQTDTTTALAKPSTSEAEIYSSLVLNGDLSKLSDGQKAEYYQLLCNRLGIDPATQPFALLKLDNKLIMYAKKECTDQLARVNRLNRTITDRRDIGDVHLVTVRAELPDGRAEESTGAVQVGGLKGSALCNALMKAETKAKRRATLSILGLGMLDESELETIPTDRMQPPAGEQRQQPTKADTYTAHAEAAVIEAEPEAPQQTLAEEILDICTRLNAAGDSIKWTGRTLANYVGAAVGDGAQPVEFTTLDAGAQTELRDELRRRLGQLLGDDPDVEMQRAMAADGVE